MIRKHCIESKALYQRQALFTESLQNLCLCWCESPIGIPTTFHLSNHLFVSCKIHGLPSITENEQHQSKLSTHFSKVRCTDPLPPFLPWIFQADVGGYLYRKSGTEWGSIGSPWFFHHLILMTASFINIYYLKFNQPYPMSLPPLCDNNLSDREVDCQGSVSARVPPESRLQLNGRLRTGLGRFDSRSGCTSFLTSLWLAFHYDWSLPWVTSGNSLKVNSPLTGWSLFSLILLSWIDFLGVLGAQSK